MPINFDSSQMTQDLLVTVKTSFSVPFISITGLGLLP